MGSAKGCATWGERLPVAEIQWRFHGLLAGLFCGSCNDDDDAALRVRRRPSLAGGFAGAKDRLRTNACVMGPLGKRGVQDVQRKSPPASAAAPIAAATGGSIAENGALVPGGEATGRARKAGGLPQGSRIGRAPALRDVRQLPGLGPALAG